MPPVCVIFVVVSFLGSQMNRQEIIMFFNDVVKKKSQLGK